MRHRNFIILIIIGSANFLAAQAPAQWNRVFDLMHAQAIEMNADGGAVFIWGYGGDSICFEPAPAILLIDTNGISYQDSTYELNFCADEMIKAFAVESTGSGFFFATTNDVSTPQDSSYVYYVDNNFSIQWAVYIGWSPRSQIERAGNYYYISSDNNGQAPKQVLRFNSGGTLDTFNTVTHPYFSWAPQKIVASGSTVLEIGNRVDNDSAYVCMRYDTAGNLLNMFSFDADQSEAEVPWFAGVNDTLLFHVNSASSDQKTYPSCSNLAGSVLWIDTLNYQMHGYHGACIDSINDLGFVFCDGTSGRYIFSYDLASGARLDSIFIDSADVIFTGIKSGPAGGVYLMYHKRYTEDIILEQYDAQLNLIWNGYTNHPFCSVACNPQDFVIDSLGFIYTVSNCTSCGNTLLVSKFAPSLVSVPENNLQQHISLFPNPANTEVRIQLNGQNGNSVVNISNALGQPVRSEKFTGASYQMNIDQLPSGVYFVQVITESGSSHAEKLVIQH